MDEPFSRFLFLSVCAVFFFNVLIANLIRSDYILVEGCNVGSLNPSSFFVLIGDSVSLCNSPCCSGTCSCRPGWPQTQRSRLPLPPKCWD